MKNKHGRKGAILFLALAASMTAVCAVGCGGNKEADPTVSAIDAVFEQGDLVVWTTTDIESLKDVLTVYEVYTDETTVEIADANYTISGTLTEGVCSLLVTYGEYSDTFDVTVLRLQETGIDATYTQGEAVVYDNATLDSLKASLEVKVNKNDGTSDVLTADQYTLAGTLTAGESTITVTYGDFTDTITVNVTAVAPISMEAVYTQGEAVVYTSAAIDSLKEALTVTLTNNDGSTVNVAIADVTLSGELTAGESTIMVTYGNFTDTIIVNVTAVAPASIDAVYTQGETVVYTSGTIDSLKDALAVKLTNNDGSTANVAVADVTLSGELTAGESTITVTYGTLTDTFIVNVTAVAPVSIDAVYTQGNAVVYESATLEDLKSALAVTLTNNDGSMANVAIADITLSGTLVAGESTITVAYGALTDTIKVNVTAVTCSAIVAEFNANDATISCANTLDDLKQYLTVTASFVDGTAKEVTDYTLSGELTVGSATITVTYKEQTASFDVTVEKVQETLTNTYAVEATSFAAGINYDAYLPTEITEKVTAVKLGETEVNFMQEGNKLIVVSDATALGAVGSQSSVALTIETATTIYAGMTVNVSTVAWGSSDVAAQVVAEVAGQKTSFADGKIILKVAPVAANKSLNWMNNGLAEYAAAMGFQTFGMKYYLSEACADGNGFIYDAGLNGWASAGAHVSNVQGAWTSVKRFYGTNSATGDVNSYTIGDVNGLALSHLALSNLNPGCYAQLRFGWAASVPTADAYIMIEFSKVPAILATSNERVVAAVYDEYQGMKTDLENGKILLKISFSGAQTGLLFTTEFENYLKSLGAYTTFGMQYYIADGADNAAFYVDCGTGAWTDVPNATKNAWTQANYWNGSAVVPFELRDINTVDLGAAEGNKYTQIRMGWANNGTTPPTEVYLYITLK